MDKNSLFLWLYSDVEDLIDMVKFENDNKEEWENDGADIIPICNDSSGSSTKHT